MFIDEDGLLGLDKDAERIEALDEPLDSAVVNEGNNDGDLFLPRLVEELVLHIENNLSHYNLLILIAPFRDNNARSMLCLFSYRFSLLYVLIIISF